MHRDPRASPRRRIAFAGWLMSALLAGCGGVYQTVLPEQIEYACADNKILQVTRSPDAQSATVVIDGNAVTLMRAGSAAQEKYEDRNYALYLDGEKAMVEASGLVLYRQCVSRQPMWSAPRQRY
jgi:membrane-bound inhibitor of C-type lysozyme